MQTEQIARDAQGRQFTRSCLLHGMRRECFREVLVTTRSKIIAAALEGGAEPAQVVDFLVQFEAGAIAEFSRLAPAADARAVATQPN